MRFVEPAYSHRSLGDVLPAVSAALGVHGIFDRPGDLELPAAGAYVVFLVDGLGYELLQSHPEEAPFLHGLLTGSRPGTAGVPSTTAVSLTSLGTAMTPGGHGVVGYTSRIPGTDTLLNALHWPKGVDPHVWQPHETAFERLARWGVRTATVNKREFRSSGLTEASSRGAEFVGADRLGERAVAIARTAGRARSLTYAYEGDLDWTGHRYGVDSEEWRTQLGMIDLSLERLREGLDDSVRVLVVADHGMVDVPADRRIDVAATPELRADVQLVGGEARFRHVYCRDSAGADVAAAWSEVLGERAVVLSAEEAFAAGWFGTVTDSTRPRIGDVVAACTGDYAILATEAFPYEAKIVGMHGSLTSAEMLIPLLVC